MISIKSFISLKKSFVATIILVSFWCFSSIVLYASPVQLKWIGQKPIHQTGVSWGVPFAKGEIAKSQKFILTNKGNNIQPMQTWPLAYWPDGSIKWLGCAAVVNPSSQYLLEKAANATAKTQLKVDNQPSQVIVNTGVLQCTVNKTGKNIIGSISINGEKVAENGHLVCSVENREKEADGILQYENFDTKITAVKVEQNGPVRAVIKISGTHQSLKNGRTLLPFYVRLYFYAGQKKIRMIHSFVYDGNQYKDFIKSIGVTFDVPFREAVHNRHVRFTNTNGGIWEEAVKPLIGRHPFTFKGDRSLPYKQFAGEKLPDITPDDSLAYDYYKHFASWDEYKLIQLSCNGFSIYKRTTTKSSWLHADDGQRASGLALVGDVSGGLAVSLKDFWQSYPDEFEIKHAREKEASLTVWFWAKDANAMNLCPYDTVAHNLNATYEDVQPGLSTPYGIARTSELTLFPFDHLPSKERTIEMANLGMEKPQLVCTPEYLHEKKAFGMWSLPDTSNPTKKWIQNQLDSAILFYQQAIKERHWYGFWNYGDIMHTYDGVRHVWRYDIGGFAWDNTELAPNDWLWYSFLRTGRADVYRMAEALTRHTSEVDCYHIGDMKGLGSRHNVKHWGGGAKEARIGQAAWKRFYYYLTTDERCGDLMNESLDAAKSIVKYDPLRIAQPKDKFPFDGPARLRWGPDWLALAGNWMTAWERTGDTKYRDKILMGLKGLSQLRDNLFTGPDGLSFDPSTGKIWYDGKKGVTNHNHLATIMGGFEILMELFDMVHYPPFDKVFTQYCKFYSMPENDPARTARTRNWGNFDFPNPRLTAYAAAQLKDPKLAKRAWSEFFNAWGRRRFRRSDGNQRAESNKLRNLYGSHVVNVPNVLNPVHENAWISTNTTSQWSLNAIMMLQLIGDQIPDQKMTEERNTFNKVENLGWKKVFDDNFKNLNNWFADGKKLKLTTSSKGLLFKAGPVPGSDADHSVIWTKRTFSGDIRVDFDFVKEDTATQFVNIIYLFAQGSGVGPYKKDITKWNDLRSVPAMKKYYEHMNTYHISFAAFENHNIYPVDDYVRARYYLPERGKGLAGTALTPDYFRTGLFHNGVKYHFTVIRKGDELYMKVSGGNKEKLFHWNVSKFPHLESGRIGLRLMASRASEFSNFKVYELK